LPKEATDEEKRQRLYDSEFQLSEKEPLWDSADTMRFGKDVFHQISCVTNKSGMDWLKLREERVPTPGAESV
jgi:glycine amidinotransferase